MAEQQICVQHHPYRRHRGAEGMSCISVVVLPIFYLHSFPCAEQPLHHIILRRAPLELHRAVLLHDLVYLHPAVIGLLHVGLAHGDIRGRKAPRWGLSFPSQGTVSACVRTGCGRRCPAARIRSPYPRSSHRALPTAGRQATGGWRMQTVMRVFCVH